MAEVVGDGGILIVYNNGFKKQFATWLNLVPNGKAFKAKVGKIVTT